MNRSFSTDKLQYKHVKNHHNLNYLTRIRENYMRKIDQDFFLSESLYADQRESLLGQAS